MQFYFLCLFRAVSIGGEKCELSLSIKQLEAQQAGRENVCLRDVKIVEHASLHDFQSARNDWQLNADNGKRFFLF